MSRDLTARHGACRCRTKSQPTLPLPAGLVAALRAHFTNMLPAAAVVDDRRLFGDRRKAEAIAQAPDTGLAAGLVRRLKPEAPRIKCG